MADAPNIEWLSPETYPDSFVAWCGRNMPAGSTQPVRIMFTGGPGTGKTTAVVLLARTLGITGPIVPIGHLAGTYPEQQRAWQSALDGAEGGILVLEAPVALGVESWTGVKEALTELAERGRRLAVVWMQYQDREWDRNSDWVGVDPAVRAWVQSYLDTNFPKRLGFPNLSPAQMVDVAATMAADGSYVLTSDAANVLRERLSELASGTSILDNFPNYRFVRRVVDIAAQRLAARICNLREPSHCDLTELTGSDVLAGVDEIVHARAGTY